MKYRLLCVGRKAQDPLLSAAENYLKRLDLYAKTQLVRLREAGLVAEGAALLENLDAADYVVALDERGAQYTTVEWAQRIERWQNAGRRQVVFIVGGADGLHASVKSRAQETVALSKATMPHRLAQVVLLEQLYRAHTVLRGERYHRI